MYIKSGSSTYGVQKLALVTWRCLQLTVAGLHAYELRKLTNFPQSA